MSKISDAIIIAVKKGYRFDEQNRIIGPRGKPLKIRVGTTGYPQINVATRKRNGNDYRTCNIPIHRLKAYYLYGEKMFDKTIVVRHLNNDCLDFRDENIAIGTRTENAMDRPAEQRRLHALKAVAKIRKIDARTRVAIRSLHREGMKITQIAKAFEIAKSTCCMIVNGRGPYYIGGKELAENGN